MGLESKLGLLDGTAPVPKSGPDPKPPMNPQSVQDCRRAYNQEKRLVGNRTLSPDEGMGLESALGLLVGTATVPRAEIETEDRTEAEVGKVAIGARVLRSSRPGEVIGNRILFPCEGMGLQLAGVKRAKIEAKDGSEAGWANPQSVQEG
jgi:hypothetical protein